MNRFAMIGLILVATMGMAPGYLIGTSVGVIDTRPDKNGFGAFTCVVGGESLRYSFHLLQERTVPFVVAAFGRQFPMVRTYPVGIWVEEDSVKAPWEVGPEGVWVPDPAPPLKEA